MTLCVHVHFFRVFTGEDKNTPVLNNMYRHAGEHDYDTIPEVLEQMQLQQLQQMEMVRLHSSNNHYTCCKEYTLYMYVVDVKAYTLYLRWARVMWPSVVWPITVQHSVLKFMSVYMLHVCILYIKFDNAFHIQIACAAEEEGLTDISAAKRNSNIYYSEDEGRGSSASSSNVSRPTSSSMSGSRPHSSSTTGSVSKSAKLPSLPPLPSEWTTYVQWNPFGTLNLNLCKYTCTCTCT